MKEEKYEFNWLAWLWAITLTIGLVVGICNFDLENIVICCLCLLPVAAWDFIFIRECVLEIKYILYKKLKKEK